MNVQFLRKITMISFLALGISLFTNCKKPTVEETKQLHKLSGDLQLVKEFSIDDLMQQIPQTVMYNMGGDVKFYTEHAETFTREDGTTIVRFPINDVDNKSIYAVMYPGHTTPYLYIRLTLDESGDLSRGTYRAKDAILDLNNWVIYQQEFEANQVSKRYVPIRIAESGWEEAALANSLFRFNEEGQIDAVDGDYSTIAMRPYPPCGWMRGANGTWLRNLLTAVGNWFRVSGGASINDGWVNGSGSGGTGSGANWGGSGTGTGTDEGGGGAGGNQGWPELPSGGGPGGGSTPNPNPNPEPNPDPNGVFDGFNVAPGAASYSHAPATTETLEPRNFRDENGFVTNRKTALEIHISEKPFGLIDCDDIQMLELHLPSLRNIAAYAPPQSVQNHINSIINANSPYYNSGNTYIKSITDGRGVVNLDLFPVKITQFPKNANGVTMTPIEFLEYFRKNFSHPNIPATGAVFEPFYDYVAGSINVNEANLFNAYGAASLGSMVHIGMFPDDGTVVLTDYNINTTTDSYWFTFSTMKTRFDTDGSHPVAGNRRFGLQKQFDGTWNFYIAGADRAWGLGIAIANQLLSNYAGFHAADQVWTSIQNSVIDFVNANQGNATFYGTQSYALRANWLQVRNYLMGYQTLAQLKAQLDCP